MKIQSFTKEFMAFISFVARLGPVEAPHSLFLRAGSMCTDRMYDPYRDSSCSEQHCGAPLALYQKGNSNVDMESDATYCRTAF